MKNPGFFTWGHGGMIPPWRTIGITGLALALYLLLGPAPEALVYDRDSIAAGEWWRLLTGHWVHGDAHHLFMDGAGLFILSLLLERMNLWRYIALLSVASLSIDGMLWFFLPWLETYCGLSGLLNALLGAGMLRMWRRTNDWLYPAIAVGAGLKIVTELTLGQALFSDTLWPPVPEAHAFELVAGMLFIALFEGSEKRFSAKRPASFQGSSTQ